MEFFIWLEETFLSSWLREALWAFPTFLVFHALGMAFLVGCSVAINLRLLGVAKGIIPSTLLNFYPVIYFSFVVNLLSGLALLISYPAKGLTNPVFYLKMVLVIAAVIFTQYQKPALANLNTVGNQGIPVRQKQIAVIILFFWLVGIFSGRFLAYTHTWLLVS